MTEHRVTVAVPSIPHGPAGVEPRLADADYYREAARNIRFQARRGNEFAGSNVTETVAKLCEAAAEALSPSAWLGGHCKYKGHRHQDCPGKLTRDRPCICPCHRPAPKIAA